MPEKIREARVFLSTQVRLGLPESDLVIDPALKNVSGNYSDGLASTKANSRAGAPRCVGKDSRFLKVFS
jgi:hypothetical protein